MLYTFYLIVQLLAVQQCVLWVDSLPTPENVSAACGALDWSQHDIVMYELTSGAEWCRPEDIYSLAPCNPAPRRLDDFRIVVYTRARESLACSLTIDHDQPTRADWASACPTWAMQAYDAGQGRAELVKAEPRREAAPLCPRPSIPFGAGLYEQPNSAAEMATNEPLSLLAGRLLWFGIVTPNCDGFSGLSDAVTLSADGCGMNSAREAVTRWQNRFDEDIYAAALAENVPARLLKAILIAETQTWTLPGPGADGEIGPFQVTDAGLDTLLRYSDPAYAGQHPDRQFYARAALRDELTCPFCTLAQADAHTRAHMRTYARLLAAYRCQVNGDWPAAARAWNQVYEERLHE